MKAPSEADLVRACLQWLNLHGHFAWRSNTGAAKIGDRFVRFGMKGVSDIIGLTRGGRFLAVEAKMPGRQTTPDQRLFLRKVEEIGGMAIVVYSLSDLELAFKDFYQ